MLPCAKQQLPCHAGVMNMTPRRSRVGKPSPLHIEYTEAPSSSPAKHRQHHDAERRTSLSVAHTRGTFVFFRHAATTTKPGQTQRTKIMPAKFKAMGKHPARYPSHQTLVICKDAEIDNPISGCQCQQTLSNQPAGRQQRCPNGMPIPNNRCYGNHWLPRNPYRSWPLEPQGLRVASAPPPSCHCMPGSLSPMW